IKVAQNKRKSRLSHIITYTKLSGGIHLEGGKKHNISGKIAGEVSLNCSIKIDNETILQESEKLEFLPWDHKEKIVPFIQRQVLENNRIVENTLPDDTYFFGEDNPPLEPGLFDIIVNEPKTPFFVSKLMKLFKEQLE
ncbi:hypothetical protein ACEF17_11440, partial [Streptococcus hyovaginalis]